MQSSCTITAVEKKVSDKDGKEQLFIRLYERYFERVYSCALFYCKQKEIAEDVTQTVFLKVWKNFQLLSGKCTCWDDWHSYLFISARNTAFNSLKSGSRKRKQDTRYALNLHEVIHHDEVFEKECNRILVNAIDKLSGQQKKIFLLTYYRFKQDAIASKLKVTKRTVSNTLNTARKKMEEQVKEYLN